MLDNRYFFVAFSTVFGNSRISSMVVSSAVELWNSIAAAASGADDDHPTDTGDFNLGNIYMKR